MSNKISFSQFTQQYRSRQAGTPPIERVKQPEYERDLSSGAHAVNESTALREARDRALNIKRK